MVNVRDVVIDPRRCFDAFSLKALMAQKGSTAAMLSDQGLKENVVLKPAAGTESLRRSVSWNFAFPVVAMDESSSEELERTLQKLLDLVGEGAKVAWGSFADAFKGGGDLIAKTLTAGRQLAALWDDSLSPGLIGCGSFDVSFVPAVAGQPPSGFVGYALMLESRWINSAIGDPGNHGFVTCQEFKVNDEQIRARGVNSSRPDSTHLPTQTYRYPVIATSARPITQAVDEVAYQILSQVHAASGSFGNFNTEVKLRVVVAASAEAVDTEIDRLTQVAAAEPPPSDDGTAVAVDARPSMLNVPATLVATTGDARRLLVAAKQGRLVHLGSHLGRMSAAQLQRIALGLQVEVGDGTKAGLATRIAERVAGGPT